MSFKDKKCSPPSSTKCRVVVRCMDELGFARTSLGFGFKLLFNQAAGKRDLVKGDRAGSKLGDDRPTILPTDGAIHGKTDPVMLRMLLPVLGI